MFEDTSVLDTGKPYGLCEAPFRLSSSLTLIQSSIAGNVFALSLALNRISLLEFSISRRATGGRLACAKARISSAR